MRGAQLPDPQPCTQLEPPLTLVTQEPLPAVEWLGVTWSEKVTQEGRDPWGLEPPDLTTLRALASSGTQTPPRGLAGPLEVAHAQTATRVTARGTRWARRCWRHHAVINLPPLGSTGRC